MSCVSCVVAVANAVAAGRESPVAMLTARRHTPASESR